MHRAVLCGLTVLVLAGSAGLAGAQEEWTGQVVAVYDGDTLLVRKGHERVRIRLYGVDAPEWSQRYGRTSGNWVAQQVLWETVRIVSSGQDKYGRYVALVYMPDDSGKTLNERLLEEGLAWVYRSFVGYSRYYDWIALERAARNAGLGLWADGDSAEPPWLYRRYEEQQRQQ